MQMMKIILTIVQDSKPEQTYIMSIPLHQGQYQ